MSQSASKVLALLELLQARPGLTGPELAERLGVDGRTVRRYIGNLVELGLPVEAKRGRHGGYRLLPGYKLPPLMFTDDEAVAVVLGLVASERLGLNPATPLAKIERVMPPGLRERVRSVRETLGFTMPAREATPPPAAHLMALSEHRRLTVTYRSWKGEETERDFDPYGVVFHAGRWYTTGHDHHSGELRTLRLDRIAAIRVQDVRVEPPPGFDPIAHVMAGLAAVPYRHEVEVLLHAPIADLTRRIPPAVGTLAEFADGVVLVCRAERLDGMAQLLAGLGCDFVVRRPDGLRAEVAALAERLRRISALPAS